PNRKRGAGRRGLDPGGAGVGAGLAPALRDYPSTMPTESSDVLIVGAGIAGTTLALELAGSGTSVTLLDRRFVGGGSSSLNAGGVRQQFSQEINVRIAVNTVRRISTLREELGEETAIETTDSRATAVLAGDRRFEAGVIVNAAGAWAPKLAGLYGGELPIEPLRSEIFVLDHWLVGGKLTPMVLDYSLGLAF